MLTLKTNFLKYKNSDGDMEDSGMLFAKNETDITLTESGVAADAKAVGDELEQLSEEIVDIFTSVKRYGAVGNGSTDDTSAIQQALAENRKVYIPAGTYKLSGELVIRDNCELTLAQDAVLNFTQTSGNCISMKMSASIMGHHGTVKVPYRFRGNAIYVASTLNPDTNSIINVPPWSRWTPQWKAGRYIKDLNITMADTRGFHYSMDKSEPCTGTAIYISAINQSQGGSTFIWGLNFSGIRIAGSFTYGIRAENVGEGWNHEMRIEAFLEACETAVSLVNCNNAYISAVIQPIAGLLSDGDTRFAYAKCGIELIRSKRVDLHGSKVWDWNATNTLWEHLGRYQHIAMIGDCTGTVLDDWYYWAMQGWDIRELIYTDTPSNLEKMTIIQEPFTRWFKPVDHKPYFFDGDTNQRLVLKEELEEHFMTDEVAQFTDELSRATDANGAVFNEIGYIRNGGRWNTNNGTLITGATNYGCTGFIPCKRNDVFDLDDLTFNIDDDNCCIIFYDSNRNRILNVNRDNVVGGSSYYVGYVAKENGFKLTILNRSELANVAYITFTFRSADIGTKPTIAINEEVMFTQEGFLADNIHIKEEFVVGLEAKYMMTNKKTVAISSASTDEQYPSAKAVYDAIQNFLGVVENGTY